MSCSSYPTRPHATTTCSGPMLTSAKVSVASPVSRPRGWILANLRMPLYWLSPLDPIHKVSSEVSPDIDLEVHRLQPRAANLTGHSRMRQAQPDTSNSDHGGLSCQAADPSALVSFT
ncbi:hypothetical protein PV05_03849 [Exophiala xenobiotica]|uniref:Uncharacterized protein n=1 Tax=Exophiala xenobiotica TaxID=348802 RepID=A0A0D2DAQ9_9EURO|nr:uncharacterized protein PV05_03849 [Exophiala xenobiotica]KIW59397.1 hypothetical protein PV05_03849 [Exophiala xenobiotica]